MTGRRLEQSPREAKLHAVCDGIGRPIIFLLAEGQMSGHTGAAMIHPVLPGADTLIAPLIDCRAINCRTVDKGYDSDAFRDALSEWDFAPCIPRRAKRRAPAT